LRQINPFKVIISGYLLIIALGALILSLPISHRGYLSPIDALFTATSAVCVTGLIVKDTATFFTPFGKAFLLILIQLGGIGYMTLATLVLFFLGRRGSLALRIAMMETYPELTLGNIFIFAKRVVTLTFIFETMGAVILTFGFWGHGFSLQKSFYHGLFHAVSAFCNAGFSSFRWSLTPFRGDPIINLTVVTLFVSGGLGFIVWDDLYSHFVKKRSKKLLFHTKVTLLMTSFLLLLGWILIFLSEFGGGFKNFSFSERVFIALFQASTPRTAGFSTIPISILPPFIIFFIVILMVIGGSPGGTAGGMKTTTIAGILIWLKSYLTGKEAPSFLKYRISDDSLKRAFSIFVLGTLTIIISLILILIFERESTISRGFLPHLFEVVSAYGTVGLSIGSKIEPYLSLSRDFSSLGKGVIILTMFVGRVGVLTTVAFLFTKKREPIRYVEGKLIVG
jgi:trk system potassium uptake protein TrkH